MLLSQTCCMLQYLARTDFTIIIADYTEDTTFADDPAAWASLYAQVLLPQADACFPITTSAALLQQARAAALSAGQGGW